MTGCDPLSSPTDSPKHRFGSRPCPSCSAKPLKLAQEWTYRFLGAVVAHHHDDEHGEERTAGVPSAGAVPAVEPTTAEVRRWALANYFDVSDRGRLRPEIWNA